MTERRGLGATADRYQFVASQDIPLRIVVGHC